MIPTTIKKKTQRNWETTLLWQDPLVLEHFNSLDDDKSRFQCIYCTKQKNPFNTGKAENILTHLDSSKHQQALKNDTLNQKIIKAIKKAKYGDEYEEPVPFQEECSEGQSNSAELLQFQVAKFIIDNNLPFSLSEELIPFLQLINNKFTERAISQSNMTRKTTTKLITHCICGSLKQQIIDELAVSPFSLAVDETTDPYGSSYLAVCAKYYDQKVGQIVTKFISIISLEESKTGEAILVKLKNEIFSKDDRLLKNLIGLATDQGSSMVGRERGLGSLLARECPYLVRLNDISHIYNLIAKHAIKVYPASVMSMIRSICSHFSASSIRAAKLDRIQAEMGIREPLEILTYVPTRWLSLTDSLRRILRLWKPLQKYYSEEGDDDERQYFLPKNELYLQTLLVILEKLCYYNMRFQTQDLYYNAVAKEMELSFKELAIIILSKETWRETSFEEKLSLPFDSLNALKGFLKGNEELLDYWRDSFSLKELMSRCSNEEIYEVLQCIQKFLMRLLNEMRTRLPFQDDFLNKYQAVFLTEPVNPNDWKYLFERFVNVIPRESASEWRLELDRFSLNEDILAEARAFRNRYVEMWNHFGASYPLIATLALALLTVAHSSVPVERVFSWLKDVKSPKRNRLLIENLEACLLTNQKNTPVGSWEITEDMIQRRHTMWRRDSLASHQNQMSNPEEDLSMMIEELSLDMGQNQPSEISGNLIGHRENVNLLGPLQDEEHKSNLAEAQDYFEEVKSDGRQDLAFPPANRLSKKRKAEDSRIQNQLKQVKVTNEEKDAKQKRVVRKKI